MKRESSILLLVLLAVITAATTSTAHGQTATSSDSAARQIFSLTNQDREEHGLPALQWSAALARSAEAHDRIMARQSDLSHDYPGEPDLLARAREAGVHFRTLAENIANGWSAEQVNTAWMHSPPHRRNILDPRLNALGVAVVQRGSRLYAVEDFAATAETLNLRQVEERVRALLRNADVDASAAAGPAEQACRMWRGLPRGTAARSVVRFQTSDLTRLPGAVIQEIRSKGFARAAAGACPPPQGEDFTMYRVAILFY